MTTEHNGPSIFVCILWVHACVYTCKCVRVCVRVFVCVHAQAYAHDIAIIVIHNISECKAYKIVLFLNMADNLLMNNLSYT